MAYISYVFTVQSNKKNSYSARNAFEVKSVVANDLKLWVTDRTSTPPITVMVFENKTELGTSIIVGGATQYLEFENPRNQPRQGYFGAIA